MHQLLNTLYVQTPRSYLHLDHETLKVKLEGEVRLQVPLLHLGAVFCFGDVTVSTALLARCAADGRSVVFLDFAGRFCARVEGPTSGNVLLRRAQHEALTDATRLLGICRAVVAGKVQNSRQILLRGAREAASPEDAELLGEVARHLADVLPRVAAAPDADAARGLEGDVARRYFEVFTRLVREGRDTFAMNGRTRRPPLDRMNALLSFLYTLVTADCVAAAEGVGLDPQVGYLHALRPGRPSLALDLVEEFRSFLADRLALTLINRRQLTAADFEERPGGAVSLTEKGRRTVLTAYQERKKEELMHPVLGEKTPCGLLPHIQARLLARHLRGDLVAYPAFLCR
jgi:CRISPR-associated protein Cas1